MASLASEKHSLYFMIENSAMEKALIEKHIILKRKSTSLAH